MKAIVAAVLLIVAVVAVTAEAANTASKCPACAVDVSSDSGCVCALNSKHSVQFDAGHSLHCCSDLAIEDKGFWGDVWSGIKNGLKGGSLTVDIPFSGFGKK